MFSIKQTIVITGKMQKALQNHHISRHHSVQKRSTCFLVQVSSTSLCSTRARNLDVFNRELVVVSQFFASLDPTNSRIILLQSTASMYVCMHVCTLSYFHPRHQTLQSGCQLNFFLIDPTITLLMNNQITLCGYYVQLPFLQLSKVT